MVSWGGVGEGCRGRVEGGGWGGGGGMAEEGVTEEGTKPVP